MLVSFQKKGVCDTYPASQTISMGILIGPVDYLEALETIEISRSGHSQGQDLKLTMEWLRGSKIIYIQKRCRRLDIDCWILTFPPTASPAPASRTLASSKNKEHLNLAHPEENGVLSRIDKGYRQRS